jgi:hypothetical protein
MIEHESCSITADAERGSQAHATDSNGSTSAERARGRAQNVIGAPHIEILLHGRTLVTLVNSVLRL